MKFLAAICACITQLATVFAGSCLTQGGKECVFPFTYNGHNYKECTKEDNNNVFWCATSTDRNGNYQKGEWGNCNSDCTESQPEIVFVITDGYNLIWEDSGSGAKLDGSIWAVDNYQIDYCSLGDVAKKGHGKPSSKALLVKAVKSDTIVQPTGFSLIWKDQGSGADWDVGIYDMNCPSGFSSVGSVAVRSHTAKPDKSKYCCVKNKYLASGEYRAAWNDKGSGANSDVSLWQVIRGSDASAIEGGNFRAVSNYARPGYPAKLLKVDNEKVCDQSRLDWGEAKPLNLYEIRDIKKVWDDKGSGADDDVSIWKAKVPRDHKAVGQVVVKSYAQPSISYVIKATKKADNNALVLPVSYDKIWDDSGSGADDDVSIWRVVCPGDYVALSNIATDGSKPTSGSIYCIKSKYTYPQSSANWKQVWADHGSGASDDVTIYEAISKSDSVISVRGMGAIASHSGKPPRPYMLRTDMVTYFHEKPLEKVKIYNVNYDVSRQELTSFPATIYTSYMTNRDYKQTQTGSRTIAFDRAESSSFGGSHGIQIGMEVELSGGIPLLWKKKTTISVSTTHTFTWGETTTTTVSDSSTATVTIPPRSELQVKIVGTQYKADIPFTADIQKTYYDGTTGIGQISGIWKGVQVREASIEYEKIKSL